MTKRRISASIDADGSGFRYLRKAEPKGNDSSQLAGR
jgi:hypothetical protein